MSLPNYLAKIKSSGIYRYVFDKSEVPPQEAETLRLVVGYSEKGPFNTPVYIDNKKDFISNFGNINKRLEKKGVFFHRMALQALNAGPILALNVKPFKSNEDSSSSGTIEEVDYVYLDPWKTEETDIMDSKSIYDLYDKNRFWKLDADQLPSKLGGGKYIYISATDTKENSCSIFIRPSFPESYNITLRDWYAGITDSNIPSYLDDYLDVNLQNLFAEVYVFRGKFTEALCGENGTLEKYFNVTGTGDTVNIELLAYYENAFGKKVDTLSALADNPDSNFVGVYQGCLLPEFQDANGNYISLDILFNSDYLNHKMLMKMDDDKIENLLTGKFYDVKNPENDDWKDNKSWENAINEEDAKADSQGLQKFSDNYYTYQPLYVGGYSYDTINSNTSAKDIQTSVFKLLQSEGLQEALTNNVDCNYHYIVDTFESFIEPECKKVLTGLARKKDNAFAIVNFPAIKTFMDAKNDGDSSIFYNTITKRFDMKLITKNSAIFSLPTDANGASWCAFYTPVIISDGTVKNTIPSAALVSNLFMEKWNSRQPYYIVAGPNHGRLSETGLIGPDYNYSRADLDVLEPFGVNVIIYVPRKGVFINSNQTAKQVPVTALSKAHVRELVIYLQNEIESMLQNYQWELNTSALRDTIKTKADTILETVAANGGVYAYLNVCDDSNNTPDIIDNEMIILDTSIEPARGAGKMVQRLTIHKTGGISSLS